MSTVTMNPTPDAALFQRFVWKEYRMLRGFWLAVMVLGVLMQWAMTQMMFKSTGNASSMLLVAWGAAALYAVGASVTLFSAETEEKTRDFLLNLPGRWLPMFAAKVTTALVSAFGLGLLLCATGGWGSAVEFQNAMAVGGVAVLEATAWGLLFSLWMKQPLLAAVLAMGAASFGAQLAIAATPTVHHGFSISSYREAVPMRLLLTLAVFATNVWLGARWLKIVPRRSEKNRASRLLTTVATDVWWGARLFRIDPRDVTAVTAPAKNARRHMMTRLLWQTWRESWKTMLAVIPIAIFLMVALGLPLSLFHISTASADLPSPMFTLLFLPALWGSLAFRADQHGDHRQFLVAHAARPRYVWLARHLVWGAGLLGIVLAVSLVSWVVLAWGMGGALQQILKNDYRGHLFGGEYFDRPLNEPWRLASYMGLLVSQAVQFTFFGLTSFFTAYALGQFFSLMFRREVLAGLLALLLSVVVVAWVMLAGFWQLSAWWFVLPIGSGAMLATWLRMPDWIVERNRPRTWALPAVAIGVPLAVVIATLPSARLVQLQAGPSHQQLMERVREFEANRPAGQETADAYFRLHTSLGEAKNETDRQAVLEKLIELTKRPECRFPETAVLHGWPTYGQVSELQESLFENAQRLQREGKLDAALERYLAIMRLKNHWFQVQTSLINVSRQQLNFPGKKLTEWAQHPAQTSELLRKAVIDFRNCPTTRIVEPILADREKIHAVLLGKESPSFLNEKQPRWSGYLAYLANRLPWERQRALLALDVRISQILDYVRAGHGGNKYGHCDAAERRKLVGRHYWNQDLMPHQSAYGSHRAAFIRDTQSAWQASTSYLVTQELNSRINIRHFLYQTFEARTRRLGLITQLALLAYRLDHQRYPETLAELVPKYLPFGLPNDPYSDGPLKYRPQGFDLPLLKITHHAELLKSKVLEATIPAHTPLLWGAGLYPRELRESFLRITSEDTSDLPDEEKETLEVIRLGTAEGYYWQSPMIFTLPEIE